jgi:hypothetical protein
MNPCKIYTLYYGTRDATTADYFLDHTANIPSGMGYYLWVATNGEHTVKRSPRREATASLTRSAATR